MLSEYHVFGSDEGYEGKQISREGETEDTRDLKFKTTEDNPKIITIQELIMEQYPYNLLNMELTVAAGLKSYQGPKEASRYEDRRKRTSTF